MIWMKDISLLLILSMAVIMDFRNYKVPNPLIITGIFLGFIFSSLDTGLHGFSDALAGSVFPAAALMFFYRWSMLGAGDIKLFMVSGAFLGLRGSIESIIFSLFIGAAISLTLLIKYQILIERLKYFSNYINHVIKLHHMDTYYDLKQPKKGETLHFSLCILLAAGVFLAFFR